MEIKKTLANWLTNRYTLIIRDEENFAEKKTYGFTYAKVIVLGISFLLICLTLSYYIITTVLSTWLDPREIEADSNRRIIELSAKMDSLSQEVGRKDKYIYTLKNIIAGKSPVNPVSMKAIKHDVVKQEGKSQVMANTRQLKSDNN